MYKLFVCLFSYQTCPVQLPQWTSMSFYPGGSTLLMSMRWQMVEKTTSFLLLLKLLVSSYSFIHSWLLLLFWLLDLHAAEWMRGQGPQVKCSTEIEAVFLFLLVLTSHLFHSTWCPWWPWSGRRGGNVHCDQLGETPGSHHWYVTIGGAHFSVIYLSPCLCIC